MTISPQQQSKVVFSHWGASQRGRALATEQKAIFSDVWPRGRESSASSGYAGPFVGRLVFREAVQARTRATTGPKGGCADEFFRERRDRSAPLPELSRIRPPTGPDR